jgi:hypothetical protein
VHLAGISDATDVCGVQIGFGERRPNRDSGGAPPIFRLLLRPANLRRSKRDVFFGGGGNDPAALIYDERARAASANVNAEDVNGSLFAEAESGQAITWSRKNPLRVR